MLSFSLIQESHGSFHQLMRQFILDVKTLINFYLSKPDDT